jgi:ubiquinone/menaquinone biosynthesis C-methylase UbiE
MTTSSEQVRHPHFARFIEWKAARDEARGQAELRDELLDGMSGRVLEVGAGSGVNFPHYPASVSELVAVEPESYLRSRAEEAAGRLPLDIRIVDGLAGELPFDDGSFDAAVVTFVLCSVPDQDRALRDLRRVLRPGGELRFYEHVRGHEPARTRWQDAVDRVWPRLMGGCHPNRDTLAAIERSGFGVVRCRGFHFPPGALVYPVAPRIMGVARG